MGVELSLIFPGKIYQIAAMAQNRVIGKDNKLPWHFPEDMKFFKKLTTGHTVIMGRKTFESIGKPLPNRENLVLTRTPHLSSGGTKEGVKFFPTLEQALQAVQTEKVFIIGGAELYKETIQQVDGIYLTRIYRDYEGDAFYPEIPDSFQEVEIEGLREADPKIDFAYFERRK